MDVGTIAPGLCRRDDGVWVSLSPTPAPYPAEAHGYCFEFEDESFWFSHRNECIETVARHVAMRGGFVDVGGGNGFVARGLAEHWPEVVLVEPGERAAINARDRAVPQVICATLEESAFLDASIDNVGAFDVIEHVDDDEAFVAEMHRILRPGGVGLFTVPAHPLLWSGDDVFAGHFRRYRADQLAALLRDVGFVVEFSTHLFAALPLPLFALRALPFRAGRPVPRTVSERHVRSFNRSDSALLDRWLGWEIRRLRRGRPIPFGTSLLVAARKPRR